MSLESIDVITLGATGYAGGELLRLVAAHPRLQLAAAVSGSRAGQSVAETFPHLAAAYPGTSFTFVQDLGQQSWTERPVALFSAAPHGASAPLVAHALGVLEEQGAEPFVIDLSADFRHDAASFEAIYGSPHPEPALLDRFFCGLPDLHDVGGKMVGEPGCFTTAVVLGAAPLVASGRFVPRLRVSAVTGSTGSGRTPAAGTHHPTRQSNLWSYKALRHRHAPEMGALLGRHGVQPEVHFVPHSGPFARGIHATTFFEAKEPLSEDAVRSILSEFYAHNDFVHVVDGAPKLKHVVGTNRCLVGCAVDGVEVVVFSAIDNLLKGASGGGVQWLNRMAGWPDTLGLDAPAVPWV